MADITIYTSLITAVAGVGGATLSQYIGVIREGRQAKRDRQERSEALLREACENLMQTVGELQIQVANNGSFRGDRVAMTVRLEKVREQAGATRLYAVKIGLQAPGQLAEPAEHLAVAAENYAVAAADNTDLDHGWMEIVPDPAVLNVCADAFRKAALAYYARR
jgi:hypothetical protein